MRAAVGLGMALALLGAGAPPASAASLGPLQTASVFVQDFVAAVPSALALATFTGPTAPVTTGTPLDLGGTWTVSAGTWQRAAGQLRITSNTDHAHLWVDAGRTDLEARVTVVPNGNNPNRRGGVVLRGSATGHLRVLYRNAVGGGVVQLQKVVGTSVVTLASGTLGTRGIDVDLRARITGGRVQAWANGLTLIDHMLSAADAATFASGTRVGVTTDGDSGTRLDQFEVWP